MGDRAHRIEVDRCSSCPFVRFDASWRADYPERYPDLNVWDCAHPDAPRWRYQGPHIGSEFDAAADVWVVRGDPPPWCPLRGSVTMITGPRKEASDG